MPDSFYTLFLLGLHYLAIALVLLRVLLRDRMAPTVRLVWVMIVAAVPVLGVAAYVLFGEVRLSRGEKRRAHDIRQRLGAVLQDPGDAAVAVTAEPAFAIGKATSGLPPAAGNRAHMLPEDDSALDDLAAGIAGAQDHVHLLFYIWLPDASGTRVAEAAMAAARRGVAVRVLVDDVGSRALIRSDLWRRMAESGIDCAVALPIGNPLIEALYKRLDLRNHRKIMVVDNRLTWTGSRNCADAAFAPKARFAPWVDVFMRVEGPVVQQFQAIFLSDWLMHKHEDLGHLLGQRSAPLDGGFTGQVIASGPDQATSGMSETLCALLYAARRNVTITTPYFLPDQPLHDAICAAARRGIRTVVILPERNDNRIVGAASEGLFHSLLRSGVELHLFRPGLLHSKIMTIDGHLAMLGSANLDRRSFDLNYECNMLVDDADLTGQLDRLQDSYVARSRPVTLAEVKTWGTLRRIRNNAVALAGPLL